MRTLWRISNHSGLEGLGGEKADGRWHTAARGKRIVYLSEHPALALIETLVNFRGHPALFPDTYRLMKIRVTGKIKTEYLASDILSDEWREDFEETRPAGDGWLARGQSAFLAVPSAPSPESLNYLFNPLHRSASGIAVEWHRPIAYDKRLFRTIRNKIQ